MNEDPSTPLHIAWYGIASLSDSVKPYYARDAGMVGQSTRQSGLMAFSFTTIRQKSTSHDILCHSSDRSRRSFLEISFKLRKLILRSPCRIEE